MTPNINNYNTLNNNNYVTSIVMLNDVIKLLFHECYVMLA